jgi:hypothetical protein
VQFQSCPRPNIPTFDAYLKSLTAPVDSFYEAHLLESELFLITTDSQPIGSFGIHPSRLLTHFYIDTGLRRCAQFCLGQIISSTGVNTAFVPTCDEFFLSHVLDYDTLIINQAYFFSERGPQTDPNASSVSMTYRKAVSDDLSAIVAICGNFLTTPEKMVAAGQLYLGILGKEIVTIGVLEPSTLWPAVASIGMFTATQHRLQGRGAQMIRFLRATCHANGLQPVAGCWYYNHASKRTLEVAVMVTNTRLLKMEMREPRYSRSGP